MLIDKKCTTLETINDRCKQMLDRYCKNPFLFQTVNEIVKEAAVTVACIAYAILGQDADNEEVQRFFKYLDEMRSKAAELAKASSEYEELLKFADFVISECMKLKEETGRGCIKLSGYEFTGQPTMQ